MPTVEKTIALKVPVSLRLPVSLARQVESYAQENHLTKTDAYEHFLRLGLESDAGEESPIAQLDLFHEKLDKILYFVSFEEKDSEKNSDICEKKRGDTGNQGCVGSVPCHQEGLSVRLVCSWNL